MRGLIGQNCLRRFRIYLYKFAFGPLVFQPFMVSAAGTARTFLKLVQRRTITSGAFRIGQPGIGHISHTCHMSKPRLLLALSATSG